MFSFPGTLPNHKRDRVRMTARLRERERERMRGSEGRRDGGGEEGGTRREKEVKMHIVILTCPPNPVL